MPAARRNITGAVELQWDATAASLLLVRDPGTGDLLSLDSSGSLVLPDAPAELDLIVTDGVRSSTSRVRTLP